MQTYTSSQARGNLYKLIDQVANSHRPICIMGKRNNAVILSEEDFSAMQETLYLLSIPGMRESILEAASAAEDKFSDKIEW